MNARSAFRERKKLFTGINKNILPKPSNVQASDRDDSQVRITIIVSYNKSDWNFPPFF
jgi:hypothetical protein